MPAITDLTVYQWTQALIQVTGDGSVLVGGSNQAPLGIDLAALIGSNTPVTGDSTGVTKAMNRLMEACRIAQEKANEGRPANERLTSFRPAIEGTPIGGYAPITRSMVARAELGSAVNIIGSNT